MKYDLEERTRKFAKGLISFLKSVKANYINQSIISQLVRSATSVGANYMEANQASSKKDFYNKIRIAQKEANETKHWLRMLASLFANQKAEIRKIWSEAHELTLIFAKITRTKH